MIAAPDSGYGQSKMTTAAFNGENHEGTLTGDQIYTEREYNELNAAAASLTEDSLQQQLLLSTVVISPVAASPETC